MTRFIDAILEPALWFAADWSLRWALLISVAALMMLIMRPRRAATRHLICGVVLLGGLLLPILPRWGSGWHPAAKETAVVPQAIKGNPTKFPGEGRRPPDNRGTREADTSQSASSTILSASQSAPSPSEVLGNRRLAVLGLTLCWALGVFVLLVRWLGGAWFLRRLRRRAVDVQGAEAETFAACRAELRVRGTVSLMTHPQVRSPVLVGLFRPAVLVPTDWPQLSVNVQRAALLHELAHLRRRDHWLAPLLEMIQVAFFFHPLVRWLIGQLEYERELLCDEMVVGRGVDRHDYARMLLEFARQSGRFVLPRLSGSSYLPIGRRRTVKARINHLLEENMERWMGSLPARWAVVLGAGLLALSLGLASYRVWAVEPEKPTVIVPKEKGATKGEPKARPDREALRYGGKNFDQWRVELETELKPEIRADGLTALAAFGANGYGLEAARTVVDLMKGYELHTSDKKDQEVIEAAFAAIAKIDAPAVPVLWESLRSDSRRVRCFAINCLLRYTSVAQPHVPDLLKAARDEDASVRETALAMLLRLKEKPESCVPVMLERLKDESHSARWNAIQILRMMRPEAKIILPALSAAIKGSDPSVRNFAVEMAGDYGVEAKSLVPALIEVLNNPSMGGTFVEIMDILAQIGPEAKDALPRLKELRGARIAETRFEDGRHKEKTYLQLINRAIEKIEGK